MSPTLAVILERRLVGHVERTRAGAIRLTYTEDARELGRTPLSLSLPTDSRSHAGDAVLTFVRALLPESNATMAAIARHTGADPDDVLAMLEAIGKDCAGAVQFCLPDDVDETIDRAGELVPVADGDIEQRLAALRMSEETSWTMPGEHWSLGGAQNKLALRREGGRWFEAKGAEATSHILKPGIRQLAYQALVEHVTMRAAAACGLDVADTDYVEFKTEPAVIVTRFDRRRDAAGLTRVHQEDVCQALGRSQKCEEYGGPGVREILHLLRESAWNRTQAERNAQRFVDAVIFNTVVAAPDAHARNYALLLAGGQVELAPLYDVATGLAYDSPADRVLSMSVGGEFRIDRIGREEWTRFADEIGLSAQDVIDRAAWFADSIPGAIRGALSGVDDEDGAANELRRRLLPAVDAHMLRVTNAL